MEIVLGVSMTPTAVRMVLVEGAGADGLTVDTRIVEAAAPDIADQVVAAIEGTREGAAQSGHRLVGVGVVWTDHGDAARLRRLLRARQIDYVVMVSQLHAAGALARAIGQTTGYGSTALLFLEPDTATMAVVRTGDGVVTAVQSRARGIDGAPALKDPAVDDLVAALEFAAEPPQAVFVIGSDVDAAGLTAQVEKRSGLPVHAPADSDIALARGAALASATIPRYDAATVGLGWFGSLTPDGLTAPGPTQLAPAGTGLGYSALGDDDPLGDDEPVAEPSAPPSAQRPPLVGTGLVSLAVIAFFLTGVVALSMSLAVSFRPAPEQQRSVREATRPSAAAPETIAEPVPVVQVAPRTVVVPRPAPAPAVLPPATASGPVPVAPAPAAAPVPGQAPPPVIPAAPVPGPVAVVPPIALAPLLPALLAPVLAAPVPSAPLTRAPAPTPTAVATPVPTPPAAPAPAPTTVPTATITSPAPVPPSGVPATPPTGVPAATVPAATVPATVAPTTTIWPTGE